MQPNFHLSEKRNCGDCENFVNSRNHEIVENFTKPLSKLGVNGKATESWKHKINARRVIADNTNNNVNSSPDLRSHSSTQFQCLDAIAHPSYNRNHHESLHNKKSSGYKLRAISCCDMLGIGWENFWLCAAMLWSQGSGRR